MTKEYLVSSVIDHNGKRFEVGSKIELTDDESLALLNAGVIAQVVVLNNENSELVTEPVADPVADPVIEQVTEPVALPEEPAIKPSKKAK